MYLAEGLELEVRLRHWLYASVVLFTVEIMDVFEVAGYRALISGNVFTDISTNNRLGSSCTEDFWLSPRASTYSLSNSRSFLIP